MKVSLKVKVVGVLTAEPQGSADVVVGEIRLEDVLRREHKPLPDVANRKDGGENRDSYPEEPEQPGARECRVLTGAW